MDPQQTLTDLLNAYMSNDRDAIADALEALREWNGQHGFPPCIRKAMDRQGRLVFQIAQGPAPDLEDLIQIYLTRNPTMRREDLPYLEDNGQPLNDDAGGFLKSWILLRI